MCDIFKNELLMLLGDKVDVLFCHQIKNMEAEDDIFRSQGNVFNGCSRLFRDCFLCEYSARPLFFVMVSL